MYISSTLTSSNYYVEYYERRAAGDKLWMAGRWIGWMDTWLDGLLCIDRPIYRIVSFSNEIRSSTDVIIHTTTLVGHKDMVGVRDGTQVYVTLHARRVPWYM